MRVLYFEAMAFGWRIFCAEPAAIPDRGRGHASAENDFAEISLLPVMVVGSRVRICVIGRGDGLKRRLKLLAEGGIQPQTIAPDAPEQIGGLGLLFVAGLDEKESVRIAQIARDAGVLVNVEDMPGLCDFQVPAQLRRGDLVFAISTSGRSPGLARILRGRLETLFGPEWNGILEDVSAARRKWRSEGLRPDEISQRTRAMVDQLSSGAAPDATDAAEPKG